MIINPKANLTVQKDPTVNTFLYVKLKAEIFYDFMDAVVEDSSNARVAFCVL